MTHVDTGLAPVAGLVGAAMDQGVTRQPCPGSVDACGRWINNSKEAAQTSRSPCLRLHDQTLAGGQVHHVRAKRCGGFIHGAFRAGTCLRLVVLAHDHRAGVQSRMEEIHGCTRRLVEVNVDVNHAEPLALYLDWGSPTSAVKVDLSMGCMNVNYASKARALSCRPTVASIASAHTMWKLTSAYPAPISPKAASRAASRAM